MLTLWNPESLGSEERRDSEEGDDPGEEGVWPGSEDTASVSASDSSSYGVAKKKKKTKERKPRKKKREEEDDDDDDDDGNMKVDDETSHGHMVKKSVCWIQKYIPKWPKCDLTDPIPCVVFTRLRGESDVFYSEPPPSPAQRRI